jgi:hypothetical protein
MILWFDGDGPQAAAAARQVAHRLRFMYGRVSDPPWRDKRKTKKLASNVTILRGWVDDPENISRAVCAAGGRV